MFHICIYFIILIQILVPIFLHFDPDPGEGTQKSRVKKKKNSIVTVEFFNFTGVFSDYFFLSFLDLVLNFCL